MELQFICTNPNGDWELPGFGHRVFFGKGEEEEVIAKVKKVSWEAKDPTVIQLLPPDDLELHLIWGLYAHAEYLYQEIRHHLNIAWPNDPNLWLIFQVGWMPDIVMRQLHSLEIPDHAPGLPIWYLKKRCGYFVVDCESMNITD